MPTGAMAMRSGLPLLSNCAVLGRLDGRRHEACRADKGRVALRER